MSELLSRSKREFWLEAARHGTPPSPVEVARKQYDLMAPWHIREGLWKEVAGLGRWPGKKKRARNMSRDHGKSIGVGLTVLWAAEYAIPFIPGLRHENKRAVVIGRDENHLRQENFDTLENMICYHAPWLKTPDDSFWNEPEALKEFKIKNRTWTTTQKDLTNGVSLRGYGFGQSVRGLHGPLIVLDDFIDDEDAHHGKMHFDRINSAIIPATIKGGLDLAVGTPIDDNDVWSFIEKEEEWEYRRFPALDQGEKDSETGLPLYGYREKNENDIDLGYLPPEAIKRSEDLNCLWPYRLNSDDLRSLRGKTPQTELTFLREYLMTRAASWNLLVHPEHFRAAKRHDLHYYHRLDAGRSDAYTFMGVDPSTLVRSDFVMYVGAKVPVKNERGDVTNNVIRILHVEVIEIKANEAPDVRRRRVLEAVNRIRVVFERFNPRKIVVEGNGFQNFIQPHLEEKDARLRGRIEPITLTTNKHMDNGWPLIRNIFESGLIELPYGPTPNEKVRLDSGELDPTTFEARALTDKLWGQLQAVKYVDGRILEDEKAQRDMVAALYFLLRAADYVPESASFAGVPLDAAKDLAILHSRPSRHIDPEFARAPRRDGFSQLARAERLRRR